jgi:mRNA interferase MazF
MEQGEIWWASLPEPVGSEPGYRRPVVIVQGDAFNRSKIRTVVCVVVTSNLALADAPGNVLMPKNATGLPRDSVANVSQVITLDLNFLTERAGRIPVDVLEEILDGIELVLGRAR